MADTNVAFDLYGNNWPNVAISYVKLCTATDQGLQYKTVMKIWRICHTVKQ